MYSFLLIIGVVLSKESCSGCGSYDECRDMMYCESDTSSSVTWGDAKRICSTFGYDCAIAKSYSMGFKYRCCCDGETGCEWVGAHSIGLNEQEFGISTQFDGVQTQDLLLICSFFIIASLCLVVGIFVGTKLNHPRHVDGMERKQFVDDNDQ
eukprot:245340_1